MSGTPEIAVVVATRNRAERLEALLDSLRAQTVARESFEVVVVDDGSDDGRTGALLARERQRGGLALHAIEREASGGPAVSRNEGWHAARAPLIAFTDDDCVADPNWLAACLMVAVQAPGAIVPGTTRPNPGELDRLGPFSRTIDVPATAPWFQTCNVVYPRDVLERLDGFDPFFTVPVGEDTDLGQRAVAAGVPIAPAPDAIVYHAVHRLGPIGKLRFAASSIDHPVIFARYPELRAHLHRRVFWSHTHEMLVTAILAALLPRRFALLRRAVLGRYLAYLLRRANQEGGSALVVPYLVVHDLVELIAVTRGAARHGVPLV